MRKTDYISIGVLMLLPFLIFYPLFTSTYLYTDEAVQLWHYAKDPHFHMFTTQGRYITEKIFRWLFGSIHTIEEVTYLRLFSFFGWLISIPIWYMILKKVIQREGLPDVLAFFSVLYMIAMPPFSVYVSWASCMELFLANTSALLSGYFLYSYTYTEQRSSRSFVIGCAISLLFGLVSLFTYQTGFGCFLLPFLLHLIATKKISRLFWIGVAGCIAIYLVYFLVFKASIAISGLEASNRTSLYFNPVRKLFFMLTRPLSGSFHFTCLFNEISIAGIIVYVLLGGAWLITNFRRLKAKSIIECGYYFGAILILLLCIYIPGLIVKENYASNRTLFALNIAVFFLVFETVFHFVRTLRSRGITISILSVLFLVNAWYNFHILFLNPLLAEYKNLRNYIKVHYTPNVHTIYFIRPNEDFFVRRYGITRSWDEFGVPSTFFDWVPEPWVKQVVFENTESREVADKLVVKHWLGMEAFVQSGEKPGEGILVINVEQILSR